MWKNNNTKMHGLSDIGPNVPAFLVKLWKLVDDPETDELICWSESGMSFIISAQAQFARELLPLYYKHNNMASFIRQLNMYGFHKIVSVEAGGLKSEKDEMEFAHQYFIKDHPYLLENIKRKLSNSKTGIIASDQILTNNFKNGAQNDIIAKVLNDVNNLKGKQESWDARLAAMKRENEALWRELAIFRQKHLKQEQIINKLIHFIVTIVQPTRNVPLRRRYPLMLNDIQPMKKITKLSGSDAAHINHGSPTGPTIHEIDPTDVLFTAPDEPQNEFISTDLTEHSPDFVEVVSPESQVTEPVVLTESPAATITGDNPDDWLEIELTEDDMITNPLTPIDPAKVNPAVAAATLKSMDAKAKPNQAIAITIPAIPSSDPSRKKPITEKKVIYLTDVKVNDKQPQQQQQQLQPRKRARKGSATKVEPSKKKFSASPATSNNLSSSSAELLFDLVCNANESSANQFSTSDSNVTTSAAPATVPVNSVTRTPAPGTATAKRKTSVTSSTLPTSSASKLNQMKGKKEATAAGKTEKSIDPFLKLDSLYNGTIDESQLMPDSTDNTISMETINTASPAAVPSTDTTVSKEALNEISKAVDELSSEVVDLVNRKTPVDPTLAFGPGSMAVVCQPNTQSQPNTDFSSRELSSHVESVQGEIDYLKEVLKGEGYSFDANTLLGLFNDDPLSYGMPPADDDLRGKENNTGSELMTYGAPNLMDLVDLLATSNDAAGTTNTLSSTSADWPNPLSPLSPAPSDLTTPAPSPSPLTFPSSKKKLRK